MEQLPVDTDLIISNTMENMATLPGWWVALLFGTLMFNWWMEKIER